MASDPLAYLFSLEQHGIKLGLGNIGHLCEALGHPQRTFESVIVAGTNGKGSVAAMIETALRRSGQRSGCFTSPHLIDLEERFSINGRPVSTPDLRGQAAVLRAAVDQLVTTGTLDAPPTFFEATTALAFALFRQAGVQTGVLEVGMGGRFDATNIVSPAAAVITTVDLDHQQFLGHTVAEIAFEKAGVIKPGVVVVTGETKVTALDVIRRVCDERNARLVEALTDVSTDVTVRDGISELSLTTPTRTYRPVAMALRGRHQVTNAVVAVRLLEELNPEITQSAVEAGLTDVTWPGRLELAQVSDSRQLLMDAAHNVAAARALCRYLADQYPGGVPLILATMRDKDVEGMLDVLRPCVTHVVCPSLVSHRARPAHELADIVADRWPDISVAVAETPGAALEVGWRHGPTVCAAGSIYLVGELRHQVAAISTTGQAHARVAE